jgi:DNA invertase Pin-like site-specific DNA recombinase
MTWEQRFGALAELDGDGWNVAYERLETEWRAAYTAAFVEIAVSRGWRGQDAGTWPVGIGDEAFIEACRYDWDPWRAAAADVVGCEEPHRHAPPYMPGLCRNRMVIGLSDGYCCCTTLFRTAAMLVGYARTSTAEQEAGLAAQARDLKRAGCERLFSEQVSSFGQRLQLAAALDYVRDGDKLIVTRLDRLARGMGDLLEITEQLRGKGVAFQVLDPAMDTSTAAGELIFHMFGAMASFERKLMLERQREGIAKARVEGRYTGRKPTVRNQAETIRAMTAAGDGPTVIARKLKVARSSIYAALKASPSGISEPVVAPA